MIPPGAGAYQRDVYLLKTDANGNDEWIRKHGGSQHERGLAVCQTYDGGYIVAEDTRSYGAGANDVYVLKTDDAGNEIWSFINGGVDTDVGNAIAVTDDEGYIIAGYTRSFGSGESDVYLIRLEGFDVTIKTKVLTPSIQAPGILQVDLTASNQSTSTVVTNVFTRVQLPNGSGIPSVGAGCLDPIPSRFPPGTAAAQPSRTMCLPRHLWVLISMKPTSDPIPRSIITRPMISRWHPDQRCVIGKPVAEYSSRSR